jgi:hypothetical protein
MRWDMQLCLARSEKTPMDNLRKTIHENEALNQEAYRVRLVVINFFNSTARTFEKDL